jgi:hypothetical protein
MSEIVTKATFIRSLELISVDRIFLWIPRILVETGGLHWLRYVYKVSGAGFRSAYYMYRSEAFNQAQLRNTVLNLRNSYRDLLGIKSNHRGLLE